ncbi:MAG: M50 family metallopeptidase [Candidatus Muirbacterium halophilum]|nr:M50 family metallopeptidase [Candidatus Muirbacterium halophilum]
MNFMNKLSMNIKLFNFQGTPIYISIWFLLLFLIIEPILVIGLFISVLVHELAHALIAKQKGYRVDKIIINILYGGTYYNQDIHNKDNILITLAGPIGNFILVLLFFILYVLTNNEYMFTIFGLNLILYIFNILPIYPMDGGQVLRSYLKMRNRETYKKISGLVSLIMSIIILIISIIYSQNLIIVLSIYFILISLHDLKVFKI